MGSDDTQQGLSNVASPVLQGKWRMGYAGTVSRYTGIPGDCKDHSKDPPSPSPDARCTRQQYRVKYLDPLQPVPGLDSTSQPACRAYKVPEALSPCQPQNPQPKPSRSFGFVPHELLWLLLCLRWSRPNPEARVPLAPTEEEVEAPCILTQLRVRDVACIALG